MIINSETLPEVLQTARITAGFDKASAAARQLDVSNQWLYSMEKGGYQRIDIDKLERAMDLFEFNDLDMLVAAAEALGSPKLYALFRRINKEYGQKLNDILAAEFTDVVE